MSVFDRGKKKHLLVKIGNEEHHIYYTPLNFGMGRVYGTWHVLSDWFKTRDIQHVHGSLIYDRMAKFMIDGREARVYDKTKENEE